MEPSQASEARRLLALRRAGIADPVSHIQGMGGKKRKTRRGKKGRRSTRKKW